jgi:hypothetical protein
LPLEQSVTLQFSAFNNNGRIWDGKRTMNHRKPWECKGFILCGADELILVLATLLLAAGRPLSF